MAHFAELDSNNIVTRVLVVEQEFIDTGRLGDPSTWLETGFNIRKNYAGKDFTYDQERDVFIKPKTKFPSWILNEDTCDWEPPVPEPDDYHSKNYLWDEETISWIEDII